MAKKNLSKLLKDLSSLPQMIGATGLAIAEAQKAFNLAYIEDVQQLLLLAKELAADRKLDDDAFASLLRELVINLTPPRYQFTETEIEFRADLSQSFNARIDAGFSVNVGVVAVNAATSIGYGYDYQAAARVRTVIHAVPPDQAVFKSLLERADQLKNVDLETPAKHQIDGQIMEAVKQLGEALRQKDDPSGGNDE